MAWTEEQVAQKHKEYLDKIARAERYMPKPGKKKHHETDISIPPADLEPSVSNESLATQKAQGFDRPVSISIHSKRNRLTDSDGACAKYLIDAITDAGLLRDDSPQEVKEVSHSQEKTKGPEITEVTIE